MFANKDYLLEPEFFSYHPAKAEPVNNIQRWLYFMREVESPFSYIYMGYYSMISAALQRRVWLPQGNVDLYPNMIIVLVGDPGIGKGRVISQIINLMKRPKYIPPAKLEEREKALKALDSQSEALEILQQAYEQESQNEDRLMFPIPADSSSLRGLTHEMASNQRHHRYIEFVNGVPIRKMYSHCSMYTILEDISDLLRSSSKETKDIVRFVARTWDCGDYRYLTMHQGEDNIKTPCLSLLAGVNVEFLQEAFDTKVLAEGFSARTIFVHEEVNRFKLFMSDPLTVKQKLEHKKILDHIMALSRLYGPVQMTPEAFDFMKNWHESEDNKFRTNFNRKLDYFFTRIKVHVLKLAMAIHFSDSLELTLGIDDIKKSLFIIDRLQDSMHVALSAKGRNELFSLGMDMVRYIRRHKEVTKLQLVEEFSMDLNESEMEESIRVIMKRGLIKETIKDNKSVYTLKKKGEK